MRADDPSELYSRVSAGWHKPKADHGAPRRKNAERAPVKFKPSELLTGEVGGFVDLGLVRIYRLHCTRQSFLASQTTATTSASRVGRVFVL